MKKLIIKKIFLKKIEDENIRICSNIKSDKKDFLLWFEVEKKYQECILIERADAFLIAILPYAIKQELDVNVENKISSKLYYQLTTYFIPMLCKNLNKRVIKIYAELDSKKYNSKKAVGTGISCGVDSFYTISKHINLKEKEFNLTHLTLFNAGSLGQLGGEETRRKFREMVKESKMFAKKNSFEFIYVDSNINEFLGMDHKKTHTLRSLSCVLILQKLFSKYYYSSGYEFDEMRIDEKDTAYYDILTVQCLSTENTIFYSTGIETNRIGKIKEIVKYKPSYDWLNVCPKNELTIEKCKRTILALDAIEKLDLYKNVFDTSYFYKHKNKFLRYMLRRAREKNVYYLEIYNEYKVRNKKIPIYVKLISYVPDKQNFKNIILKVLGEKKVRKLAKQKDVIDASWEKCKYE